MIGISWMSGCGCCCPFWCSRAGPCSADKGFPDTLSNVCKWNQIGPNSLSAAAAAAAARRTGVSHLQPLPQRSHVRSRACGAGGRRREQQRHGAAAVAGAGRWVCTVDLTHRHAQWAKIPVGTCRPPPISQCVKDCPHVNTAQKNALQPELLGEGWECLGAAVSATRVSV